MSTNSSKVIVDGALNLIRSGKAVSFASVAQAVNISKPGLMYHFKTKKDLMMALVDAVADDWLDDLATRLAAPNKTATVRERVTAYLEACIESTPDPADLAMLSDPRLRNELLNRWSERMGSWLDGIEDLPALQRGGLTAVRLMADGIWFASATGIGIPTTEERAVILTSAEKLLDGLNE